MDEARPIDQSTDPKLPDYPLDQARVRALAALYSSTRLEINRYRDYAWRITAYVTALLAGSIAFAINQAFRKLWTEQQVGTLRVVILLIAGAGLWLLVQFNRRDLEERRFRDTLHETFRFTVAGMFGEDQKPLIVIERRTLWKDWRYTLAFVGLIVLMCGLAWVAASVGP